MHPSYIRVRAVVWAYGRGQTDRQTDRHTQTRVTTIHFASSTTHAKCNDVDHLKQVLISCWDTISQELINEVIVQWSKRLLLVIRSQDGHIEHRLH